MIRTITIGDIHGRNFWKDVNPDNYDYIIFIGDYYDSFDIPAFIQYNNMIDIIEFKKKYSEKVILLLGNHDIHYWLSDPQKYQYSGFDVDLMYNAYILFKDNRDLFQIAFQINYGKNKYLWTHAGITHKWYYKYMTKTVKQYQIKGTLADKLNILFESNYKYLHNCSEIRDGKFDYSGPFWAHNTETLEYPLNGYHQIVGHTYLKNIKTFSKNHNTSITYTDVGFNEYYQFYELDIDDNMKEKIIEILNRVVPECREKINERLDSFDDGDLSKEQVSKWLTLEEAAEEILKIFK